MADSNLDIKVTAGGVEETVRKLNSVNDKVQELGKSSESIQALGSSFAKLSLAITAFATGVFYAAVKTDELRQALDNIGGRGTVQFAKFSEDANKMGLGIEAVAKAAIKLEATGLTNDVTRKLIDSVGEAVRKMGGGDAQFTTVINGLEMIAATGVLTNRSLRTLEKTAPELKGAIETAFGTDNTKKIIAMNLTVEEFMSRVANAAARMSPHTKTMGDAFVELKNTVFVSMGSIGDTIAVDLKLVDALAFVSVKIKELIKAFQDLDPTTRKAIEYFGLLMITIGPLLLAIPVLIALFSPLGLAVLAIGVIIAGTIAAWDALKTFAGYVTAALYAFKAGLEMLMIPILMVGGMILKLVGFIGGGVDGFKAAAVAVDEWTISLFKNIAASDKKAEQIRQNTSDLIRLKAQYDKMAAEDGKVSGTDSDEKQTGNKTILKGVGGDQKAKIEKEIKDKISDVQFISSTVLLSELEADEKASKIRWQKRGDQYRIMLGDSAAQITKENASFVADQTKLDINSQNKADQLKVDNQKAFWASNPYTPAMVKGMNEFNAKLSELVNQGLEAMGTAIGVGLGKAFASGNFKDLGKGLLSAVGGLMVQFGQLLVSFGIGMQAIKAALNTLNPVIAIAGGIALIALGTFVSDSASAIGSGIGGGGGYSAPSSSSPSGSSSGVDNNLMALQKMSSNSNSMAKVIIKGSDLALVMQRNTTNTRQ